MEQELIFSIIISLAVGILIGFILFRNKKDRVELEEKLDNALAVNQNLNSDVAVFNERLENEKSKLEIKELELVSAKDNFGELQQVNQELLKENISLSEKQAGLNEKLENQKKELEGIGDKFTNEFKVLADRIFEEKSEKFSKQNQDNLKLILDPLGKNINDFKSKVEETYEKENKQRFSLEKEIEKLVALNSKISEEAHNLTRALKGSSKTQGDWGEMILENILENSGLTKGREYHVQEFLKDDDGKILKDESGKKMQPDVIMNYPDQRKIIIDSKVSLLDYERYVSADIVTEQKESLTNHISSIKRHIDMLSAKSYQNFAKGLDFVMMFIPIEPAYLEAIKHDSKLWDYAYKKRILLISPTNLIAALKMLSDLWKREYQNQNALEIAERGGKLYDKFVSVVEGLNEIGASLNKTQGIFNKTMNQMSEGRGNVLGQVQKLKDLGAKTEKSLPEVDLTDS
ncbi:MAG: DNA recombination protein RmuC [Bacteroidota bacterium]